MAVPLFPVYEQINGEARYHEHPALRLSDAERTAGVTPVNYAYPPLDVRRYGFDASNTTSDQSAPINAAIAVAVILTGGVIEFPACDFRASVTVKYSGIYFHGAGGVSGATRWRNVGAAAPLTWDNVDRGIIGGGISSLELRNQDSAVYTTTDGLVLKGDVVLNQLDYLTFEDFISTSFRDCISITGRTIWNKWDRVRGQIALRDGFHVDSVDNFSMQEFSSCRFGNNARHGWYGSHTLSPGGLLFSGITFSTCNLEINGQQGFRLTGTGGVNGLSFLDCYGEENGSAIAALTAGPTKSSIYIDSVYALGVSFNGVVMFDGAGLEPQYYLYVDTATTVNIAGSIENCRFGNVQAGGGGVYWPAGCMFHSDNSWNGTNVLTRSSGSLNLHELRDVLSWTPVFKFGGGVTGQTYVNQRGWYNLSGRQATIGCYIQLSAKGSSAGAATITGLPIATLNQTNFIVSVNVVGDQFAGALAAPIFGKINPNTQVIDLYKLVGGGLNTLTEADFSNNTTFTVSLTYLI